MEKFYSASDLLVLIKTNIYSCLPGQKVQVFDAVGHSYEMMISSISASEVHSILKPWPELKSLEIPEIIDMKELDFKPFQNHLMHMSIIFTGGCGDPFYGDILQDIFPSN